MESAVQVSVSPAVQSVADGISRGSRDWVDAGQGGVGGLVSNPSMVGPSGEAGSCGDGPKSRFLKQGRGLADLYQLGQLFLIDFELVVEFEDALGQTYCLDASDGYGALRGS